MQNKKDFQPVNDLDTFIVASSHHTAIIKEWKRDIETRRDEARNYLISGEDTLEIPNDELQVEPVTFDIPTSPNKAQTITVPPVVVSEGVSFPTKFDIIKNFTLNSQQTFAFMIVVGHLDGDSPFQNGILQYF
jgi:hypothetical protein